MKRSREILRTGIGVLALFLIVLAALPAQTPPVVLKIASKNGDVTYYHFAHVQRAKGDCKVCHPALFTQDAHAPLRYRDHAAAEAEQKSCGACHRAGGSSFSAKDNCTLRCHHTAAPGGR
jgi:c(7)-type cytochrome triheme protein